MYIEAIKWFYDWREDNLFKDYQGVEAYSASEHIHHDILGTLYICTQVFRSVLQWNRTDEVDNAATTIRVVNETAHLS